MLNISPCGARGPQGGITPAFHDRGVTGPQLEILVLVLRVLHDPLRGQFVPKYGGNIHCTGGTFRDLEDAPSTAKDCLIRDSCVPPLPCIAALAGVRAAASLHVGPAGEVNFVVVIHGVLVGSSFREGTVLLVQLLGQLGLQNVWKEGAAHGRLGHER